MKPYADSAPQELEDLLAAALRSAFPESPVPAAVEEVQLAAIVAAACEDANGTPRPRRLPRRRSRLALRVVLVAAALLLVFSGLALADTLPAPLQNAAARAAGLVGLHLHRARQAAPRDVPRTSRPATTPTGPTATPAPQQSAPPPAGHTARPADKGPQHAAHGRPHGQRRYGPHAGGVAPLRQHGHGRGSGRGRSHSGTRQTKRHDPKHDSGGVEGQHGQSRGAARATPARSSAAARFGSTAARATGAVAQADDSSSGKRP